MSEDADEPMSEDADDDPETAADIDNQSKVEDVPFKDYFIMKGCSIMTQYSGSFADLECSATDAVYIQVLPLILQALTTIPSGSMILFSCNYCHL
jgi:hypothetical protein